MITFKQFLLERAPNGYTPPAQELVAFVLDNLDVEEIKSYRGKYFDSSNVFQLRFKPKVAGAVKNDDLVTLIKSPQAKKLGIKDIKTGVNTGNSGKFKGTTFTFKTLPFELILGAGQNEGEKFEKEVLTAMQDYVKGKPNDLAESAFTALEDLDIGFSPDEIDTVKARTGSTSRVDATPEEMGKIIADIIVEMNDGTEFYLSVKNQSGDTVGQFGLVNTFREDFTVDTSTKEWKMLVKPLNLDVKKIEAGFNAYVNKEELSKQEVTNSGAASTAVVDLFKRFFGIGYVYLRQKSEKFVAVFIDDEFLDNKLLSGLKITEIRYPNVDRKQVSIFAQSSSTKFKLELRNAKGGVKPAQIQLKILSTTLEEMK